MGYAKHVGRVGALAVALGIGTAVITTPGIAWADGAGASSTDGPSQNTPSTDGQTTTPGGDTTPTADTGADHTTPTGGTSTGTTTTSTTTQGSTTTTVGGGSTPQVTFGGSTNTGSIGTTHDDPAPSAPPSAAATGQPIFDSAAASTVAVTTVASTPIPIPVTLTATVTPVKQTLAAIAATTPNAPGTPAAMGASLLAVAATPSINAVGAATGQVTPRSFAARLAAPNVVDTPVTAKTVQNNTASAVVAPTLPTPSVPPPSLIDTVLAIPGTIISTALNLITQALAPFIGPGAPADNPILWGVLAFVRRQFNESFANSTPVLAPRQTSQDIGGVHGTFGGTDANGDTLAYSVPGAGLGAPTHGDVTINQATGTYTYTPDAGYVGQDYFFVTATDDTGAPHVHAFGQTHLAAARVDVTVAPTTPVDHPPVIGTPAYQIIGTDHQTGTVTGRVNVTDPDAGDTLTYTLNGPATIDGRTVTVDSGTGSFTYAPTTRARLDAYSTAGEETGTFGVTADDGHGGVRIVPVSVLIDPQDAAITRTSDFPAVPGTPSFSTVTGADGTAARTVYSGEGTDADPYRTMVTVIHPDNTITVMTPIEGYPYGRAVVGSDGTTYQTTRIGTGTGVATDGPTTVTVIRPDGTTTSTVMEGTPLDGIVVSPDGTAYQTTSVGNGHLDHPYYSLVTIIHPEGDVTSVVAELTADSGVVVGPDGTVYQTTSTFVKNQTLVTIIHADGTVGHVSILGQWLTPGVVAIGGDGTVYQSSVSTEVPGSRYATFVTIIRPDGSSVTGPPITGYPGSNIIAGADGTAAQLTGTVDGHMVTLIRPDGTMVSGPTIVDGGGANVVVVGDDGRVYQSADTGNATTLVVLHSSGTPATVLTITGSSLGGVELGPNGTAYQTTVEGDGSTGHPYVTTVTVVHPGDTTTGTEVPGFAFTRATIGSDGVAYQTTLTGDGSTAAPFATTVALLHPDGTTSTLRLAGFPYSGAVTGTDGTVYQATVGGSGSGNDPYRTSITAIHADGTTNTGPAIEGLPVPGSSLVIGADRAVSIATSRGSGSSADPVVYSISAIAFAAEPVETVL